ncbi:MAG: beta-ketoacyl-[acyl-carrier-protein] synthase family protein [archaeon]|nr:beta-ketoacyl-[acyl-carrier-protein] synthase family protein [archaeon]
MPIPDETRLLAFGFLATAEALHDAKLDASEIGRWKIGCTVSASKPNLYLKADQGNFFNTNIEEQLSKIFRFTGPCQNIVAACATGANSLMVGADWIREGVCDIVVCGACESSFHSLYISGFRQLGVLTESIVRPFDMDRDGFAPGEGSGILVLERKDRAMLRGAHIYGALKGSTMAIDSTDTVSLNSNGKTIAGAIERTLELSKIEIPGYINAHGTATQLNDRAETAAIKTVFGKNSKKIPVSSTKAATGHLLGASGAVEIAFSLLSLRDNIIPPTLNYKTPDPELDLNYVPNAAQRTQINTAMSLSFGFGGQIGVSIFERGVK